MRHRFERGRMSLALAIAVGLAGVVSLAGIVQAHGDNENGNGTQGGGHTPVTICHWVPAHGGSYIEITIDDDGLHGHGGHANDIIPAPAHGCPDGDNGEKTKTPAATGTVGAVTQTPVVTKTPKVTATVGGVTQTPAATKTPVVTGTVGAVTQTPVVTKTPKITPTVGGVTQTPVVTKTPGDNGGVFPCPPGYTSIKVDPPVSGTYGGIQVTFSADGKSVSFVSPFPVDIVIVKGGPDANQYGPNSDGLPATSLSGLVAPTNPGEQQPTISFVRFCIDKDNTVTPTATGTVGAATSTPVKTATHTATRTATATGTVAVSTNTPVPTATSTVAVTQTSTPQATGTVGAATSTPQATGTVGGATSTPDDDDETATPDADTATPDADTPTGTATTQAATSTTTPQGIVGGATQTPIAGVGGVITGPQAQARGGVALPDTGTGDNNTDGGGFVLAFGALAIAGAGFTSLLLVRRRLS